jgi:hypothetical protein
VLLVRSEEKTRSAVETALYVMFALSALLSIWQFVEQPIQLPISGFAATCSVEHHI